MAKCRSHSWARNGGFLVVYLGPGCNHKSRDWRSPHAHACNTSPGGHSSAMPVERSTILIAKIHYLHGHFQ